MADLPTDSIGKLEELLTGLGYDLAEHEAGQADAALDTALADALTKVQGMYGITDAIDTPEFRTETLSEVADFKEETTLTMNNYAKFRSDALDDAALTDFVAGKARDRNMPEQFIANPQGVVRFVDAPDLYLSAYKDLLDYKAAPVALSVKAAPVVAPASPAVPLAPPLPPAAVAAAPSEADIQAVDAAIATAAAGLVTQIKDFNGTGQWDEATYQAYLGNITTFQELLGEEISGHYSPELAQKISAIALGPEGGADIDQAVFAREAQARYIVLKQQNPNLTEDDLMQAAQQQTVGLIQQQAQQFPNAMAPLARAGFLDLVNQRVVLEGLTQLAKPPEQAGPALGAGPNGGAVSAVPAVTDSVKFIEEFLSVVGPEVDKSNPTDAKVTMPDAIDGTMDAGTQAGLQQVFGALRMKLGIPLQSGETSTMLYTPEVGALVIQKINSSTDPQIKELRDKLAGVPAFANPKNNKQHAKGVESVLGHLDYLYLSKEIEKKKVAESVIPEIALSGMQAKILQGVVGFLGKMFPSLLPMIDGFLRQFTGGMGLMDFLPAEVQNVPGLKESLGALPDDPQERMAELFKQTFAEDVGGVLTALPEDRTDKLQGALDKAARGISHLPWGDAKYRHANPKVYSKALEDALDKMHNHGMSVEDAANEFSNNFINGMKPHLPGGVSPQHDPDPSYVLTDEKGKIISTDSYGVNPLSVDKLVINEFDPDGDGVFDEAAIRANISEIQNIYSVVNEYKADGSPTIAEANERPVFLTGSDGRSYIAGIDRDSNLFSVFSIDVDLVERLLTGETTNTRYPEGMSFADRHAQVYEDFPGYALGMSYHGFLTGLDTKHVPIDTSLDFGAATDMQEIKTLLAVAEDPYTMQEWRREILTNEAGNTHAKRVFNAELIYEDREVVQSKLAHKMHGILMENVKGGQSISKEAFKEALKNHVKDVKSPEGQKLTSSEAQQGIINKAKSLAGEDYINYMFEHQHGMAEKHLKEAPRAFINKAGANHLGQTGHYYLFASRHDNTGNHFVVDIADDMRRFVATSQEDQDAMRQNKTVGEKFPSLEAVTLEYPRLYANPFKLAEEHVGEFRGATAPKVGARSYNVDLKFDQAVNVPGEFTDSTNVITDYNVPRGFNADELPPIYDDEEIQASEVHPLLPPKGPSN